MGTVDALSTDSLSEISLIAESAAPIFTSTESREEYPIAYFRIAVDALTSLSDLYLPSTGLASHPNKSIQRIFVRYIQLIRISIRLRAARER